MKLISCANVILALVLFAATDAPAIVFTNLYSFSPSVFNSPAIGQANGGATPDAALLVSGNSLYGTTAVGGSNNDGTVFLLNNTEFIFGGGGNTAITNLHIFNGHDGSSPQAELIIASNTLFGTTASGGAYGAGTVFALSINGTGFTNLFNFAFTNGANPEAGLVLSGNTLYGTTTKGGAYGAGALFAISTNGTGFTNLYNFNYTNGANPQADLLLLGSTLYGTTVNGGGSNGLGTIFSINTDGSGFTNLFTFTFTNGAYPYAGLALLSNVLCGTTEGGGSYNYGTVFLIATNGTGFNVLYNFADSNNDGEFPYSRLVVSSNGASSYSLFGTTEYGGQTPYFNGTVFSLTVTGPDFTPSGFSVMSINFSPAQLEYPMAGLALSGNTLYGIATFGTGSSASEGGGLFRTSPGLNNSALIHTFTLSINSDQSSIQNTNSDGGDSQAGLVLSGNTLYGTALEAGTNGNGTVFAIHTDGTGFANLYNFSGGGAPLASLLLSGNTLYGTAANTGASGTLFALTTDGTDFTNLFTFSLNAGFLPDGALVLSSNTLYGVTEFVFDGNGVIYRVTTNGTGFTNFFTFDFTNGSAPYGGLVLTSNTLYGITKYGGSNDFGTVFAINADGTDFTNLLFFNGTNGSEPHGTLISSGNALYGTTEYDLNRGCGTIFAVNTDGTGFTNLYNFSGYDGANPAGGLFLFGDTLYGTTTSGGSGGYGTVFAINTDGSGFTNLHNFSGANDGATPYDGLILSGNTLYGTTSSGGSGGNGTVFALSLGPIPLNVQQTGGNVILTWGNPAFSLQSAPTFNGPYTTVTGAASPYTNTIAASQQFFRLQAP